MPVNSDYNFKSPITNLERAYSEGLCLRPARRAPCRPSAVISLTSTLRISFALIIFVLSMSAYAPMLFAESPQSVSGLSANRFLFIVDTSIGMKRLAPDVLKIITEIIGSSASGQLRAGDTVGLWTFNQEVSSDLPIQPWNFAQRAEITDRIISFLRHRRVENSSRFDRLLPEMFDVIKNSDILTIFIISNGEGTMTGTPFDAEINSQSQHILGDMAGKREPVVMVLQSKGGRILKYTMNVYPWPVVIPELPLEVKLPADLQPKPANALVAETSLTANPVTTSPQTAPVKIESVAAIPAAPVPIPSRPVFHVPPPPSFEPPPLPDKPIPATPPFAPPVSPVTTLAQPSPARMAQPPSAVKTPPQEPLQLIAKTVPYHSPAANPAEVPTASSPVLPPTTPAESPAYPASGNTNIIPPTPGSPTSLAVASTYTFGRSKGLLAAVITLAFAALLLITLMIRRYFVEPPGPSLITRSMTNKRR